MHDLAALRPLDGMEEGGGIVFRRAAHGDLNEIPSGFARLVLARSLPPRS